MASLNANSNLHKAKNAKKDEFYTQLEDIENELRHYIHHFKNKVVYCNCDDPNSKLFSGIHIRAILQAHIEYSC